MPKRINIRREFGKIKLYDGDRPSQSAVLATFTFEGEHLYGFLQDGLAARGYEVFDLDTNQFVVGSVAQLT